MGLFNRNKVPKQPDPSFVAAEIDYIRQLDEGIQTQLMAMATFLAVLFALRMVSSNLVKGLGGEHVLSIHGLNNVNLFKEVFLAYLNAAILEPVLAIGGNSDHHMDSTQLIINLLSLGSICWWIYLITDAFSFEDVTQFFKYHVYLRQEYEQDPSRYPWFKLGDLSKDAEVERSALSGMVRKDVALWFMLACILAAWLPGVVQHKDVLHAYVIVMFWIMLHHYCRQATAWRTNYLTTLLFPSTALMPLEYCLPLMDVADTVEDLEFVEQYRQFIKERTGVEMIIET